MTHAGPDEGGLADVALVTGKVVLRVELEHAARLECLGEGPDQRERRRRITRDDDPRLRPFSAAIRATASSKVIVRTESVSQSPMPAKQGHWSLSTPPLIRDDRVVKEIRWFEDIRLRDTDLVGGKGANLGELTAGGLPVPPGFVITGEAYLRAIGRAGARERLVAILAEARTAAQDDLDRLTSEARHLVDTVPIPDDLAAGIVDGTSASEPTFGSRCGRRASARMPKARRSPA